MGGLGDPRLPAPPKRPPPTSLGSAPNPPPPRDEVMWEAAAAEVKAPPPLQKRERDLQPGARAGRSHDGPLQPLERLIGRRLLLLPRLLHASSGEGGREGVGVGPPALAHGNPGGAFAHPPFAQNWGGGSCCGWMERGGGGSQEHVSFQRSASASFPFVCCRSPGIRRSLGGEGASRGTRWVGGWVVGRAETSIPGARQPAEGDSPLPRRA